MSTITWLHLSDLHFREAERWDEDIVLSKLLDDVQEQIMSEGLRPDFVIVSGDIAFQSVPEEYALAKQFLDELLEATDLPKTRLFIVPGNHDVDRKAITRIAATTVSLLDNRQAVNEVLAADEDRSLMLHRFNAYAQFVGDYLAGHLPFDDKHYFYVRSLDLADRRVAVLGLNSAWLAYGGDKDRGRLVLGERQVRQALRVAENADVRIALLHHPFDWLRDFDREDCEALLVDKCDFILHGHLHRTGLLSLKTPDARATIIATGACYEAREQRNGYNLVRLDLETLQGTIYLRMYSDQKGGFWTKDVMTYRKVEDGRYTFELPSPLGEAPVESRLGMPPIPMKKAVDPALRLEASYLRRVLVSCNALPLAVIDPRAVERTRQQTMNLLAVYVALDTHTAVAVAREESEDKGKRRELERLMEPGRETRTLTALEAAGRDRQMVLLGGPGSGKSTFANYLALCLAGARLERLEAPSDRRAEGWLARLELTWTHGPLLPLQVTLRHLARSDWCDGTAAGLWNFVADTLTAQGLADFAPYLHQQLLNGGVMVLLDGLDEVADPEERKVMRDAVADFAATYGHPANRYLVTCRSYAYQDPRWRLARFTAHTLAPFNQKQIDNFIGCWYKEVCRLGWKSESEAEDLTRRLQAATRRPDLASLARNSLQLTMMASLHFSWGRLPEDRVRLYQEMAELLLVRWQEARLGEDMGVTRVVSAGKLESALERVAFIAHHAQEGPEGTADVSEVVLRSVLKDYLEGSWDRAGELVTYIQERAALLIELEPGVYAFPHRSYQEYLAGSYLAVQPDFPDKAASLIRENYAQWREAVLCAVGVMAHLKKITHVAVDVAAALCPCEVSDQAVSESDWRAAHLAGEALLEIGLEEVKACERHEQVLARVLRWLAALLERGALTARERVEAGNLLARLGDPRPGVCTLPPDWVEIPTGPFIMGSREDNELAYEDEHPQHQVNIGYGYRISRYPVTNAQYKQFIDANPDHEIPYIDADWAGPYNWDPRGRTYPPDRANHPVVLVSWYDAIAYCRWLTEYLRERGELEEGQKVRLPTEAEWEKAARGTDGREWPWGNKFDSTLCNMVETRIGTTSAVGLFPAGASPYSVLGMAGNVWEWTGSIYESYPYDAKDGREDSESGSIRVLHGGSFYNVRQSVRCAFRLGANPCYRVEGIGIRVVISPSF